MGFNKSEADPNLYFIFVGIDLLILVLYVDDLFHTSVKNLIAWCKENLLVEFKMKDISTMHYFLGLEVWQRTREIFLRKGKCAMDILKRFWMEECKPMATPMITNLKKVITLDS
jgi:hypothetical protein